MGDVAESAEG